MNVSNSTLKKVFLYLIFLVTPLLSHAQFYQFLDMLVNDTLSYEFQSVQFPGAVSDAPNHGTATIATTSNSNIYELVYMPNTDYVGRDTLVITYYVSFVPRQRTIEIEVLPSFIKANNDYISTPINTAVTLQVMSNDEASDSISLSNVSLTNDGDVLLNPDGSITFTPISGFTGEAYFNYTICLDPDNCDVGVATVFVDGQTAMVDTINLATKRGVKKDVLLPMDNGFQRLKDASNGTLTEMNNGIVTYSPNIAFFNGRDTFTYAYNTNTTTSIRTFVVHVLNTVVATPQGIAKNDYAYVIINGVVDVDVLANDNQLLDPHISLITLAPANGAAVIVGDKIKYTPNSGFTGVDRFTYKSCILPAGCESADVFVVVDNQFPSATSYDLTTIENTPLVINYQIPITDFDFVVSISESDEEGLVEYHPGYFNGFIQGQQVIGYNLVVYTPPADYHGFDHFEFEYCVGSDCELVKIDMNVLDMTGSPIDTFCVSECVWAGDANNDGRVNITDLLPIGYCIGEVGIDRLDGSVDWYGQFGDSWNGNISQTQVNLKHVDTDGDGFITAGDTTALNQNYGYAHNLTPGAAPVSSNLPLYFVPRTPGPYNPGDLVVTDIFLGNASSPALDMYGLTFAMNYNSSVVEPGSFNIAFDKKNWMAYNSPTLDMIKEPASGRVEVGYTRTSGVAASGYGKVGSFSFIVIDDVVDGLKAGDTLTTYLSDFVSPVSMNGLGIYEQLPTFDFQIKVTHPDDKSFRKNQLIVYPNPTDEIVNVHVNGDNEIRELFIYSLTGQRLYTSGKLYEKSTSINISHFESGLYIINAITDEGVVSQKIEVLR